MTKQLGNLMVPLVAVLILFSLTIYTVDQRQAGLVFQLGEVVAVKRDPGLYFKLPLVQNVRYFDTRILTLDSVEPERFITSEKKNVLVDYYIKWRIIDVQRYYVSFAGDEKKSQNRLAQTINDGMRAEFGKRTVHDVVSGERDNIMEKLRASADADARRFGVQVMDVRIKRVELPSEVSESVYRRMEAERKRVANELRSTGAAEAEQIKADADKQREVIIAEAYKQAQTLKGQGDAKATALYSAAYGKNPEFYAFYRSMESYKASFKDKSDVMVLQPNSAFFRYMNSPRGSGK
jgi:modulator of FtsH protease HflC